MARWAHHRTLRVHEGTQKSFHQQRFAYLTVAPISGAQARCSEYIYPEDFLGIYDTPEQVAADEMERRKRDDYDKHSKISSRR